MKKNKVIVSCDADPLLISYLEDMGADFEIYSSDFSVDPAIKNHPDLVYVRLKDDILFKGDGNLLKPEYPGDVIYNGFSTGKYFIHDLRYTSRDLLEEVNKLGLITVNVKQGYSGCSIVPVNEDSIITYDRGITEACGKAGMDVLIVEPGHVSLPGFDTGFIGGASGKVGDKIIFNGDLSAHPDHMRITDFIESKGLEPVFFASYPLRDIGSIV